MQAPQPSAKDPTIAVVLSLFFPGLGHLYAGKPGAFVAFLALELVLFNMGWTMTLIALHIFQAIAAGGAVKVWNQRLAVAEGVAIPPPPRARTAAERSSEPPPVPPPPPRRAEPVAPSLRAELGADDFLAELQAAWREHRSGVLTARQFADRKWRAIRALRVEHGDEGEAIVEAARDLATAGVLTSEEIAQLDARVRS